MTKPDRGVTLVSAAIVVCFCNPEQVYMFLYRDGEMIELGSMRVVGGADPTEQAKAVAEFAVRMGYLTNAGIATAPHRHNSHVVAEIQQAILSVLDEVYPGSLTAVEIIERAQLRLRRRSDVYRYLRQLIAMDVIERLGKGRAPDVYRYRLCQPSETTGTSM